jgi:tetratricopeptide (TPR) repeat protein
LNLRPLPGLVPPELRFGKAPSREQQLAAVKERRARRWLRLADLLRVRGHTRASIIEYQKARDLLGPRNELAANHLARAYLEIASPAQAISALLPVLEYYPDKPGPQVTMGIAYLRSGDPGAARQHFKVALRINPFNPEVHCGLARALGSTTAEAAHHARLCQQLSGGE